MPITVGDNHVNPIIRILLRDIIQLNFSVQNPFCKSVIVLYKEKNRLK
jgi:hypothetical protein